MSSARQGLSIYTPYIGPICASYETKFHERVLIDAQAPTSYNTPFVPSQGAEANCYRCRRVEAT